MQRTRLTRNSLRRGSILTVLAGLLAVVLGVARPLTTAMAAPPAGSPLALVPADAVAFAHVKLGEVWNSDLASMFRTSFEKAGAKAIAALDEQLDPPPAAFESFTFFLLINDQGPLPFAIISFNRKLDETKLVKHFFPNAESKTLSGKSVHVNGQEAIHFVSDRQVIFSTREGMTQYLAKPVEAAGPMRAAIDLAMKRPVVLAGHIAALPIPANAFREIPPEIQPLLKVQDLMLSMELQGDPKVHFTAMYKDATATADAEKALGAAKAMAKSFTAQQRGELEKKLYEKKGPRPPDEYALVLGNVMGIGALNRLDEVIDNPGIRKDGTTLAFDATIPKEIASLGGLYGPVAVGLLLPATMKVREAAERAKSMNNLRQLALGIHNYLDANGKLPEDIKDKNGKPLLSWRVAILPYIEQEAVYRQFKLDEPWDSPANKIAARLKVSAFFSPNAPKLAQDVDSPGLTHYLGVAGPGTAFDPKGGLGLRDFQDGSSYTIMLVETSNPVPWAKPGDFEFDPKKPLPNFLFPGRQVFGVALADGSVRAVNPKVTSEKTLKEAFTRSGGEIPGVDW